MKNILIINGYLDIGGAERVLTLLANNLCEDYKVTFATMQKNNHRLFDLDSSIKLVELNMEEKRKSMSQMGTFGFAKYFVDAKSKIRELTDKMGADLVIAFNDREVYLTWFALHKKRKVKLLYSQRNAPSSKPKWSNILLRYIYKRADGVVFQLDSVRKFYGIKNKEKYRIIENPVKIGKSLDELLAVKREKKVIGVGRLTEQKRFDVLIRAFTVFSKENKDYKLEIYGSGDQKEKLKKLIHSLEMENSIEIKSPIPNVMEENKTADMFVLSSDFEGIPNVLMEAMASGIPSISTDCVPGGAAMLLNGGDCGLLVKRNSVEDLANAMNEYSLNETLKKENMIKAYKNIQKFEEKIICNKWSDFIKQIVESKR